MLQKSHRIFLMYIFWAWYRPLLWFICYFLCSDRMFDLAWTRWMTLPLCDLAAYTSELIQGARDPIMMCLQTWDTTELFVLCLKDTYKVVLWLLPINFQLVPISTSAKLEVVLSNCQNTSHNCFLRKTPIWAELDFWKLFYQ